MAQVAVQAPSRAAPSVAPAVQRPGIEDLLAGRVLAWAGGLAVLVGIVLLFAIAVSRGWIGEELRTLLGALTSFSLVAAGAWLHEHKGRTDAALAATAAGIGGLFAAAVVASRVYELIPITAGLGCALATGAVATWLAVRWRAQGIAALGIVGGLAAPVALGATQDAGTIVILFAASLSAAAVCVRFGWEWIAAAAFAVTLPQWIAADPTLVTLIGFGVLYAAMAVGFEVRERADGVRPVAVALLALNAFVLAAVGWEALGESTAWIAGLGAVHAALGLYLLRDERSSRPVALVACGLGVVLLDIALGQVLSGAWLACAWAAAIMVAFAPLLARVRGDATTEVFVGAGLAGHLALALGHTLTFDAWPDHIAAAGVAPAEAIITVAALAAACFASGFVLSERAPVRMLLDVLGLAAVAYVTALTLDGAMLVAAFAAEAVLLSEIARRNRDDDVAAVAAGAFTALALGHAVLIEAPPHALLDGVADLGAAAIALMATALAAIRCAELRDEYKVVAWSVASVALLHLASVSVVTVAGAGPKAQALLSVLWGVVGVAALIAGLVKDVPAVRTGALMLLAAAMGKVFLYDLATLTPIARVASFIVLGLLLLLGAFAWERIRPRPLPDLREVPPGLQG